MMMSQPKHCKLYMWKRSKVMTKHGGLVGVEIMCGSLSSQFISRDDIYAKVINILSEMCT